MREGRRLPIKSLMKKLNIAQYDHPAPWQPTVVCPSRVVLPLKQGAGTACVPSVRVGDKVTAGQPLGAVPDKALGAIIHAPFAGKITQVTSAHITLLRT
jgi:Na+-translocating ferredoxin:NAD+ oxidoreductase RnfC subunit